MLSQSAQWCGYFDRAAGIWLAAKQPKEAIHMPMQDPLPIRRTSALETVERRLRNLTLTVITAMMYITVYPGHEARTMNIGIAEIRNNMADALNRVAYQGERIVLERRGKGVAALVPMDDLALLEAIEDREDVKAARKALAEMKRKGGKPIPWEKVKQELGL